jgi:hypothetical protein
MTHRRLLLLSLSVTLAVTGSLLVNSAPPARADDTTMTVSALPAEFVIGKPGAAEQVLQITARVTGPSKKRVVVEFVDFFVDERGQRVSLPAGSTPYSLANILKVTAFDDLYLGKGDQVFTILLEPKLKDTNTMYSGGILIRLESPKGGSTDAFGSESAILSSLNVTPFGFVSGLKSGTLLPAKVIRHDLFRLARSSFIDSILPDLPAVVNYGGVESRVEYLNPGEIPTFVSVGWKFSSDSKTLASKRFPDSLLPGGKTASLSVFTQLTSSVTDASLNPLPNFGFVSNEITIRSSLGGTELPPHKYDGSFLVMQWKEPLVALIALYVLVRWAWRRNLSKRKKEESASLLWLALRDAWRRFSRPRNDMKQVS